MKRGITRIALVVVVVLGTFVMGAITVTADPDIPTDPLPPVDRPGPRVGFWFTQMPKLAYVDGEDFVLRFTAVPLTGAVQVWNLDISTFMTYGSRFEGGDSLGSNQQAILSTVLLNHGIVPDSSNPTETLQEIWRGLSESQRSELIDELKPLGFRYEPWESALDMLRRFWVESGLCDGMLGLVGGDGGSMMLHYPCLAPRPSIDALVEHAPSGWYEFTRGLTETLQVAIRYAEQGYPVEVFVVNRGPYMDSDRDQIPEMIDLATAYGIRVNVVPMGNEPGPLMRFPYLKPLRELAEATGGSVYYDPNLVDRFDFSMLPRMVPQMMRDFYGRMSQIDRGTLVAPRASLVLAPSEYVQVLSPATTDVGTGAGTVRINFENLTIGAPQSVDIHLRVSTNITGTLLPVFQGSTSWTDSQRSYFEWSDPTGGPHRSPLPQRAISVTMGAVVDPPSTATPAATRTRVPPPTPSPVPTMTPTATATATMPPSPLPTESPVPTRTATASPVPTATPTATRTAVPSPTPSYTPSATPTATRSPTPSYTRTVPPTATPTATPGATMVPETRIYNFYITLVSRSHRAQAYAPYPAPQAIARVEIPVLDALWRRFFP
jgi:hypothetical protein